MSTCRSCKWFKLERMVVEYNIPPIYENYTYCNYYRKLLSFEELYEADDCPHYEKEEQKL